MIARHITHLLPLWVEGDLDARASAAVEAHLGLCEFCRAEADALRDSQAWLKSGGLPPFHDADRDRLRREVLARIGTEPRAPQRRAMGWGAAVLVAAATLVVLLFHRERPEPARGPAPRVAAAVPAVVPPKSIPAPLPLVPRPVLVARRHPVPSHPDPDEAAGPGASRIEMQTSNPQIRIIWLARATPRPDGSSHPVQEDL
ncbi:MAG TPA: zf-HC2 domain-containing protein [Holophagaceae bacterium]|nr:zf-HC2 domain-containing protein [Holophagaceae bacterium]